MSETADRVPFGLNPALLLVETAWAAWLGYAHAVFTGTEGPPTLKAAAGLAFVGALASAAGGPRRNLWRSLASLTAFAALAGGLAPAWGAMYSWPEVFWLAGAFGLTGLLVRAPAAAGVSLAEAGRWVALLAAGTLLMLPFYTHRPIGSGDAHWYSLMLSDYVLQVRAGIFPVWVGQTEYAFNGAVNPLRLAPWFQHAGALLDLLTCRRLDLIPLKNALLCLNLLMFAGTAYACLRQLRPERPNVACVLTLLLLASPAILAPLYVGDQYMTFLALPFAILAVTGMALAMEKMEATGWLLLTVGLSGLWLAHTPIALWLTGLLALAYAVRLTASRPTGWWRWPLAAFAAFLVLGTYPIVSVLQLENTNTFSAAATGSAAAEQLVALFPHYLKPLGSDVFQASGTYQPGYTVLALAAFGVVSALLAPGRALTGLTVALLAVVLLMLPMSTWASLIWPHLPQWFMKINGQWPHQRLIPIFALLAVVLAMHALRRQSRAHSGLARGLRLGLTLVALAWSGWQAAMLVRAGWQITVPGPRPGLGFQPNNLSLTRYAFNAFASIPGYYSHGYINPRLEHRLLRADGSLLLANAPAAASLPIGTLINAGTFTAVNDNGSQHYKLLPSVLLPGKQELLLKLEVLDPSTRGWLQVVGEDIFREYMLPDSGAATVRDQPRAFGLLPGMSPYVPLRTNRPHGETPRLVAILPGIGVRDPFPFARFELWQFDPARLPVAVRSWAPYRLHVTSPEAALVETPRAWLAGYSARVNGRTVPVQRSADGLAMFPVPAGESHVAIRYAPPLTVSFSYWLAAAGWLTVAALAARRLWRNGPAQRPSSG